MKTPVSRKFCWFLCSLALLAGPAISAEGAATSPTLKVQVKAPPSWTPLPGDRFPELFSASLSDALTREGCALPVTELRSVENPAKVPFLLKIDVTDWRVTKAGDIRCTFTASLKTPAGERRLGEYAGTRWVPGIVSADSSHAYLPAQLDGVQALCQDLNKSKLLAKSPGLHFATMSR